MCIKDRTLEYIRYKKIPIKQFEEKSKLSNGYISSMRKGFGTGKLENVLKAFPDINRDWLLYGEGDMLKFDNIGHTTTGDHSTIKGDININEVSKELELANLKIAYLEQILKDKQDIIEILKNKK
ncbi:MAG: hypothetical protein LBL18_00465 [Bacteroidales bacterium]|jgi:hypothetical protein|nr:hypothetical protein [Bacteroidales bacterium]